MFHVERSGEAGADVVKRDSARCECGPLLIDILSDTPTRQVFHVERSSGRPAGRMTARGGTKEWPGLRHGPGTLTCQVFHVEHSSRLPGRVSHKLRPAWGQRDFLQGEPTWHAPGTIVLLDEPVPIETLAFPHQRVRDAAAETETAARQPLPTLAFEPANRPLLKISISSTLLRGVKQLATARVVC